MSLPVHSAVHFRAPFIGACIRWDGFLRGPGTAPGTAVQVRTTGAKRNWEAIHEIECYTHETSTQNWPRMPRARGVARPRTPYGVARRPLRAIVRGPAWLCSAVDRDSLFEADFGKEINRIRQLSRPRSVQTAKSTLEKWKESGGTKSEGRFVRSRRDRDRDPSRQRARRKTTR